MNQDDFRRLLATPRPNQASSQTLKSTGFKKSAFQKEKDDFKFAVPSGTSGYRDRAKERRFGEVAAPEIILQKLKEIQDHDEPTADEYFQSNAAKEKEAAQYVESFESDALPEFKSEYAKTIYNLALSATKPKELKHDKLNNLFGSSSYVWKLPALNELSSDFPKITAHKKIKPVFISNF